MGFMRRLLWSIVHRHLCPTWTRNCLRSRRDFGLGERGVDLRHACSRALDDGVEVTPMLKHLLSKIKATGPITVAEYMRETLTNPVKGDFVTSPEISQMFGELMAVWVVSEWMAAGQPSSLQVVEFGPGRGSLSSDMLRVFEQFHKVLHSVSISLHLVEVSPALSEVQEEVLCGSVSPHSTQLPSNGAHKQRVNSRGVPVSWYRNVQDVPEGFSFYLAHEFFDALPIHKFQKTERGWREVLVDLDPSAPNRLRFVLAPTATVASNNLIQLEETRDHVEVSPEAGLLASRLAERIAGNGGGALIVDYGHTGSGTDTFRAFRQHHPHDVLTAPGLADLTADVDFAYLSEACAERVACLGPLAQRTFLHNMGIDCRLQALQSGTEDDALRKQHEAGYSMLMSPDQMGERFKFFALLPHKRMLDLETDGGQKRKPLPVAGFTALPL
uniref:protein arginine methyltransferase NDUFAF7, mitochondrial isoform X2 n=1 Tax=Myxine glutinosa TaxID=7769 RepID=UPI00358F952F